LPDRIKPEIVLDLIPGMGANDPFPSSPLFTAWRVGPLRRPSTTSAMVRRNPGMPPRPPGPKPPAPQTTEKGAWPSRPWPRFLVRLDPWQWRRRRPYASETVTPETGAKTSETGTAAAETQAVPPGDNYPGVLPNHQRRRRSPDVATPDRLRTASAKSLSRAEWSGRQKKKDPCLFMRKAASTGASTRVEGWHRLTSHRDEAK